METAIKKNERKKVNFNFVAVSTINNTTVPLALHLNGGGMRDSEHVGFNKMMCSYFASFLENRQKNTFNQQTDYRFQVLLKDT